MSTSNTLYGALAYNQNKVDEKQLGLAAVINK